VSNLNDQHITVIERNTFTPIDSITVASARTAWRSAATARASTWATTARSISVIDTAHRTLVANMPLDSVPEWITLSPDGQRLYVAKSQSGSMGVVSTAENRVLFDVVMRSGSRPSGVSVHPDGSRVFVLADATSEMTGLETISYSVSVDLHARRRHRRLRQLHRPVERHAAAPDSPGPLSGIWWNPNESGWGINFTQRHNNIFAAWYTYDSAGNAKWYVASNCSMPVGSNSCSGRSTRWRRRFFFGVPFDSSKQVVTAVGALSVAFNGNNNATMSYNLNGQHARSRSSARCSQPGPQPPFVDYTDLWWNPQESGWGSPSRSNTTSMFLAWYVYDGAGKPTWFVVPNCAGERRQQRDRTSRMRGRRLPHHGPPFGPTFDPTRVTVFPAGKMFLDFTDPQQRGAALQQRHGVRAEAHHPPAVLVTSSSRRYRPRRA
jgi:hypothetical protein